MATKKAAAKETPAKKTAGTKAPAKKAAGAKPVAKAAKGSAAGAAKSTAKAPAKGASKKAPAKKSTSGKKDYTKPELREKIKREVIAGDKGGRAGQWSARKAQLLAHEYEAQGGGYTHPRNAAQKSLKNWGEEKWHTADGKPAIQGEETHRYLPDKAWKEMSPEERKATDTKKVEGAERGEQFVKNTAPAAKARKRATKHAG